MMFKHLLMLLVAIGLGSWYGYSASQPRWVQSGYERVSYAGYVASRQQVVSLVYRSGEYGFESREVASGRVVKYVKLETTEGMGESYVLPSAMIAGDNGDVFFLTRVKSDARTNKPLNTRFLTSIWSLASGKCLAPATDNHTFGNLGAVYRDQAAWYSKEELLLWDKRHSTPRRIPSNQISSLAFLADGKHLACLQEDFLLILDWESGQFVGKKWLENYGNSLSVLHDGTIMVSLRDYWKSPPIPTFNLERWRWNSSQLERIGTRWTKELPKPASPIGRLLTSNLYDGSVHVCPSVVMSWPEPLHALCTWLTARGLDVQKYWAPRLYFRWYVLDQNNVCMREYQETTPYIHDLPGGYRLKCFLNSQSSHVASLEMHRTGPVWPNAVAIGLVCYLGLFVWLKHRAASMVR